MTTTQAPLARRTVNTRQDTAKAEPVKAPVVQESAKPIERKRPVTWKDLMIKYMLKGVDGITPDLNESGDPVGALNKMIEEMADGEQDTGELAKLRDFYAELHSVGQPGRQPVKIGDDREYNVQQAGEDGDLFVRIPLNPFGVQRGQKIVAHFGENEIVIRRLG